MQYKCSFCGKDIEPNDIALAFKNGRMCNDCAKKYNLLQADGYPSAKVMNYCLNHTVEDFKYWIKSSQELGTIKSDSQENYFESYVKKHSNAICAICCNETDNYLKFKDGSVVCINCGKKYGLTDDNGNFSTTAKTYASNHSVSELKKMLDDYGEFSPKEVQLENSPSTAHSREQYRSKNSGNNEKHSIFYYIGVAVVAIFCFNLFVVVVIQQAMIAVIPSLKLIKYQKSNHLKRNYLKSRKKLRQRSNLKRSLNSKIRKKQWTMI